MPHIRFRAVEERHVKSLSASLRKPLADAVATTEDNFTFELIPSQFYFAGQPSPADPFVEVLWFSRPKEVQQKVADILTAQVKAETGSADVAVVFTSILQADYFWNGKPF